MAIDIEKMKEKLNVLKNKGNGAGKFWKPQEGTQTVRILPTEDGDPFKSFFFHYNVGSEGFLCPKANFGETCPVCDFVSNLYRQKDPESLEMAKKLGKKQRFFSPVLVRGEEKEGARIYGYSKGVYEKLIQTVLNPDYGDITDLNEGIDITIDYGKKPGKKFPDTDLTFARKSTKTCKELDAKGCTDLLAKIPDFNTLHKRKSTGEVQTALDQFLSGEPEAAGTDEVAEDTSEGSGIDDAIRSLQA